MTENEAKEKWCPMAREVVASDTGESANRDYTGNCFTKCIASGCMMWWWSGPKLVDEERDGFCGFGVRR